MQHASPSESHPPSSKEITYELDITSPYLRPLVATMKALKALTHHHHFSSTSPTEPRSHTTTKKLAPPTVNRRSIIYAHFRDNEPPLRAASFSSFANDQVAHEAEKHGRAHIPDATYFTLILSPPLEMDRVKKTVLGQVPELEAFGEERAVVSGHGLEQVKIARIRGSVRGWWSVLQGLLDDDGGACFLKRVPLVYKGREVDGYRATPHFPDGMMC